MARHRVFPLLVLAASCEGGAAVEPDPGTGSTDTTMTATTTGVTTGTSAEPTTTGETGEPGAPVEPACCGCLCIDPGVSCGANTCTPEGGGPAPLGVEAGLWTVPSHPIAVRVGADWQELTAPASRLWYAFRPADEAPESRPTVLFFNGGPGSSTAVLFGTNTGAWTLAPAFAHGSTIAENPHSWTRFANLLYVDPKETGYSYDVALPDGTQPALPFIPEHDAAVMVRFMLAFLAGHPQLRTNPVILVGESWGGVRATLMGHHLLFSDTLLTGPVYRDPELHARVQDHLAAVAPDLAPDDPATAARQFGHRVLIQPVISTGLETSVLPVTPHDEIEVLNDCLGSDPYQCDESGWSMWHHDALIDAIVQPDVLSDALGLEVASIAWMHPKARTTAYPRPPNIYHDVDEAALHAVFGELPEGHHYYMPFYIDEPLPDEFYEGHPGYARMFVQTLPYVRTFVTNAGKDAVVYSLDLVPQIAYHDDLVASAIHDPTALADEPRPGRIVVKYHAGLEQLVHTIRFPFYAAAGHMVTARAPGELLADVEAWYAEP